MKLLFFLSVGLYCSQIHAISLSRVDSVQFHFFFKISRRSKILTGRRVELGCKLIKLATGNSKLRTKTTET